jgi:hypothetical protein
MTRHGVAVVKVRILHPGAQKDHRNSGGGAGEYRAPIKTPSPVKANAARPRQSPLEISAMRSFQSKSRREKER